MDLSLPGSGQTVTQDFSVFNYDTGKYLYFTAPISAPPLTGHYRAPRNRTPEGLAEPLPPGARRVGEGAEPKGMIASLGDAVAPSTPFPWAKVGLAIAAVTVLYKVTRRRR